jgi:aryl-alcohol dehydrogenase-like predicted oxidoreductase
MLTPPGVDPVEIVTKALRLGVTYFDTSNAYGPSQANYGAAFRINGLVPRTANYNPRARESIYLASKTHMRTTKHPPGERWRSDYSDGMPDMNVVTAVDDVRRSLSLIFGDGKGQYPPEAYLDCIQVHNINAQDDVDMIYEGLETPNHDAAWLGALSGLLDLRDGTNRSGANPRLEKLVRHIGITGHYNAAALMYAIQRDSLRIIDTLLVALNPSDLSFFNHQYNTVPVAAAAGMGVIAMKVFLDAVYYGAPATFARTADNIYQQVGTTPISSAALIQYALSIDGVNICLTGIGKIDPSNDPTKCQLSANLAAAQLQKPLLPAEKSLLEAKTITAGLNKNEFLQRLAVGLTPPRNVGAESDAASFSPATPNPRQAVRVSWDTAYAGSAPIVQYEVLRDGLVVGTVRHHPQWSCKRFVFEDVFQEPLVAGDVQDEDVLKEGKVADSPRWAQPSTPETAPEKLEMGQPTYIVRSVDATGRSAASHAIPVIV